jgi:hypothetical protein
MLVEKRKLYNINLLPIVQYCTKVVKQIGCKNKISVEKNISV